MEVAENIVFKCSRTHYADEFTISYGEAIFLFAPPPMNMLDKEAYFARLMKRLFNKTKYVRYVENNTNICSCKSMPKWISCISELKKNDIRLINENIEMFRKYRIFNSLLGNVTSDDIDCLESGDLRLVNLILSRLKGNDFIELNIVGLSFESIRNMLNFILADIAHCKVAYIIVYYTDFIPAKCNPISLTEGNVETLIELLKERNNVLKCIKKESGTY